MMDFPIFEAMMLICFGSAWPFSIWKSARSKSNSGKSLLFLYIIDFGYLCGILHRLIWAPDRVIILYILNFSMVSADIILFYRNRIISQ
jgi:hypothetical protein